MTLRFGTDGVRGDAESELTSDLVQAFGRAAARVLGGEQFVIGRDTRISGPRIEHDLSAGLAAEGAQVELLGVVPTPVVAWLAAADGVPGAMISASHNGFADNGIKLFTSGGQKLSDATEQELEAEIDRILAEGPAPATDAPPPTDSLPAPEAVHDDIKRYEQALIDSLGGSRLDTLTVVIDCANGSASMIAPEVLSGLGVNLTVLHADPDGRNINDGCGSTFPDDLKRAVVAAGADVGLAFDGDADRVVAVDETGELIDGDQIIAMCAIDRRDRGLLVEDTVVVTVMTNLGFKLGMADHAIKVVETQVGDRQVLEALEAGKFTLGGEQSGHVIFRDLATTGDGLLTGLQVLDLLQRSGRFLSDVSASAMSRLPQVLRNVAVSERDPDIAERLRKEIMEEQVAMEGRGRVLIRPSGTEPLVRVMVEAPSAAQAEEITDRLVSAVERIAGSTGSEETDQ